MNIAHFLVRNAGRAGDLPAVACGNDILLSHQSLASRSSRLAASLRQHLGQGARVAIISKNRPEYVEILCAIWWAGLAAVPINSKLHSEELDYIIEHADVGLILVDPALTANLRTNRPCLVIGSAEYERLFEADPCDLVQAGMDDMAWLFYTSGTTGRPKGAMITHGNLRAMAMSYFIDIDQIDPAGSILHAAPLSHGSGLYLIPHLIKGACQIVPESAGFDEAEVARIWRSWQGITMFLAPTMVKRMVRYGQTNGLEHQGLKTIVYGGAPMYRHDLDQAHELFGFKLAQLYGQGEAPMTITALDKAAHADVDHPRYDERLQSAGTAQSVVEVKIADEAGNALPIGERGEIMARGPIVVPGYWRDPEATNKTMGDGWLRTGDVGVMDRDGFLTLKDRSKDLIISGGSNVYPREVEEVLQSHPNCREAAVIGVRDEEWGEIVVACLVVSEPTASHEFDELCLARIARFKRPKRYHFLDALPKNNYGKILKTTLRERFG